MTVVSDSTKQTPKKQYKSPSRIALLNWWKVTRMEDKFLSLISFGFFYDFRNDTAKPNKLYTEMIDKILDIFEENIDDVDIDSYYITYDKFSIWIANKPYAVRVKVDDKEYGLTVNQIARVLSMENYIVNKKTKKDLEELQKTIGE